MAIVEILRRFKNVPEGSFFFIAGVLCYFAFQWAFFRPIRTYVFGHELSHAVAAWMSGAKVRHFHVSKKGGSVHVSKTNTFIALAPYILPIYALVIMGAYFAVCYFYPQGRQYWHVFLWALGAAMGFHMALTGYALRIDQPDLKAAGKFLSGVLIYMGNAGVIIFVLGVLFPKSVSYRRAVEVSGTEALDAVRQVSKGTQIVWEGARRVAQK